VAPETSHVLPDALNAAKEAALRQALEDKFGRYNTYLEIFDPYDNQDEETVHGTLAGDLAEIYNDLQDVFAAWNRGRKKVSAMSYGARFQFVHHWGESTPLVRFGL
jgi:hypothetical protein